MNSNITSSDFNFYTIDLSNSIEINHFPSIIIKDQLTNFEDTSTRSISFLAYDAILLIIDLISNPTY